MTKKTPKGIGLLSGGLDSALASLVVRDAGADVECLHFFTGFCVTGHNSRVGRRDRPIANHALKVAADMGIPVQLVDIASDYLPVVLKPKFGYGKNMNPCVDCRIFMLARARDYMKKVGADFVFTGEVVGQRPKSQMKTALRVVAREVGLEGSLLRPLSAKLLPPTVVEEKGLIDRNRLHDISGRGRKRQLELARHYGLKEFMQPAGGCCFLTDKAYSDKLRDVMEFDGPDSLRPEDIFVLGVGRHFRLSPRTKIVVGRNEVENNFLGHYQRDHWSVSVNGFAGPVAVVMGDLLEADVPTIAAVVARYSDGKREPVVEVNFKRGEEQRMVLTEPAVDEFIDRHRV